MYFAEFCDIIKDGLLYIFQSGGLSGGKSASLGHISGWDRVLSTGMSRLGELDHDRQEDIKLANYTFLF